MSSAAFPRTLYVSAATPPTVARRVLEITVHEYALRIGIELRSY